MVEYRDHRKVNSRKKWIEVVLFENAPHDWPSRSDECIELAKFTHAGDAYIYASNLVHAINGDPLNLYHTAWAVVVR